jgi:phthiocerol/phenolphthiocerol synthesis type-I polyketide synthase B
MTTSVTGPIAIVGIGCRFPGGVADPEQFWTLLSEGRSSVGDIPEWRIDLQRFYDATPQTPGKTIARYGGYLSDIDQFDADFFGISPREAETIDPQQRLLLETAWEALENAGADVAKLKRASVGVFIGQWLNDFEQRLSQYPERMNFAMTLGSGRYAASGRLSYTFDFTGPAVTLDTACSSSLTAVHLAVQSLRSGESDLALAGGVNVILAPHIHIAYSQSGMMAPDGRCKFGDARADGYVRSEGAAILVLKPLQAALDDRDRIHAVIRGSAINNDGRSSGSMGTPSQIGQQDLLRRALNDAGADPLSVGYVEAHGTGTRAGDKVEIGALAAILGKGRPASQPLRVGSVKTNLGHTEGAAGAAGLIKAVLAVSKGVIPASLNLETPNPDVPWHVAPIESPRTAVRWPSDAEPRLAGVSAFGIAGANAHVIVEAPPEPRADTETEPSLPLLTLSASSEAALRALAERVAGQLERHPADLGDVVRFAQRRRTALSHRAAFLAENADELCGALRAFAADGQALAMGIADSARPSKVAFIFPCQGGQWVGMARSLIASEPGIRAALERADAFIRREVGWSLIEKLCDESDASDWADTIDVIQPALAALSIAYAEWLRDRGVPVDAVVGHSMGEASAAHFCGALSLEDALRIVCRRSALMKQKSGQGAMALVDLPIDQVNAALVGLETRVSVAAANSPRACIISGDAEPVAHLVEAFVARGVFSRLVKVDVASHSPHMEGPARTLLGVLEGLTPAASDIPFVSSLLGRAASGLELDAAYWARNLREPVRFADALTVLSDEGISAFVELGPHPALSPSVEQAVESRDGREPVIACCGLREAPERVSLLTAVARLWCAGVPIDWARGSRAPARVMDFPLYPWQRRRYWAETAELVRGHVGSSRPAPDEQTRSWMHRVVWREFTPDVSKSPSGAQPWLVLGEASDVADALARAGAQVRHAPFQGLETQLSGLGAHKGALNVLVAAPGEEAASFLPVRVAQAVMQGAPVRLWFVTRGAQSPVGASRLDIDLAALWGAARVLSDERPDIWGGLLDLPGRDEDTADLALVARLLLDSSREDQIAIRGRQAFVPRLVRAEETSGGSLEWRPDGAYLLTGGHGDVGLAIARAMVDDGARRLILAGRTELPPRRTWNTLDPASKVGRRVAAIRALESKGAAIHCWTVDVSDEDAVKRLLDGYEAEGWPPIRGVIHLAAVLERGLIGDMKRAAFDASLLAKLRSAQVLDRLLPDLDCFVLFSSLSALLPQPGLVAYVAANAGLQALAENRRAQGRAAACIAWGTWHGVGLMAGESASIADEGMERQGISSLTSEQGTALFAWAAGRADPFLAVLPVDWATFTKARASRAEPFLSQMKGAADQGGLAAQLADAKGPARRAIFAQIIAETVAQTLRLPVADVDHGREFGTMGMTSLLAMEMRNRLERALGVPLSATLAWNYPTVSALSAYLAGEESAEERRPEVATPSPATLVEAAPDVADELAVVANLSDDDALTRLRQRRAGKVS